MIYNFPPDDDDFEELYDSEGISFKVGGGGEVGEADNNETSPRNPNCFAWCLMNLCISRILQQTVKKMVAGVGLEVVGEAGLINRGVGLEVVRIRGLLEWDWRWSVRQG